MNQNLVVGIFEVESEAYQAITELKQVPGSEQSLVVQAVLVRQEDGKQVLLDSFDTGITTRDDTARGGIIGALIGILGGPIGVLFGASYGALIGAAFDAGDAVGSASMIEQIADKLDDGDLALIALAGEENEAVLDNKLGKFKVEITRFDAAVVAAEVEEAEKLEKEMARDARKKLREDKKAKAREKREELEADLDAINKAKEGIKVE